MINRTLNYTVIIHKAEEGGYVGFVPFLPGCMTQGETLDEVRSNIKDAIEGYLFVLKEDNESIPVEKEHPISANISVALPA